MRFTFCSSSVTKNVPAAMKGGLRCRAIAASVVPPRLFGLDFS
jgi:hypothetical protein